MAKAKAPTRDHFWDVTARYGRKEFDGSETELTKFDMRFDAKLLHDKARSKESTSTDPRTLGEFIVVRKGAAGIVDGLLGRMRDAIRSAERKKK